MIVDKDNQPMPKDDAINPGGKIRVVVAMSSLFFRSDNQCRLTTKVARIQLLQEGEAEADVDSFMFDQ